MPNYKKKQLLKQALTELEKAESAHSDAEIKNKQRLNYNSEHSHNISICRVLTKILDNFKEKKVIAIVEAEILETGRRSNPEDIVLWIEDIGLFVLEIKSHRIDGIKSFENNIPQLVYDGKVHSDTHILDQPRRFAYELRGDIEPVLDEKLYSIPALYFAAWLPNISPSDLDTKGEKVGGEKIWLSDMLERDIFLSRLPLMKNLTGGNGADRQSLETILKRCFGCSSGLRPPSDFPPRTVTPGNLAYIIAERNNQLKRLTIEQEGIIKNKNLLIGPKVIRGVAGSGKTIVLANAVANRLLDTYDGTLPLGDSVKILVLCYNRSLVPLLKSSIYDCFHKLRRQKINFPKNAIKVCNIDRFAADEAKRHRIRINYENPSRSLRAKVLADKNASKHFYNCVFIDEGQDIDLDWFEWIKTLPLLRKDTGPSIIVFYDDAQNLYGRKRPGTGQTPPWRSFLGGEVHSRGIRTIMRVGHRNTNEILTFSFNLLLGTFAPKDPMMATFADITSYLNETIPEDSLLAHPNAGKSCIEKVGERDYKINFAIHKGPFPAVYTRDSRNSILLDLIQELKYDIDPARGNIAPSDILVTTFKNNTVDVLMKKFSAAGIPCRSPKQDKDSRFFQEGKISVSTIHSAKGYTAHISHLVFVDELNQPGSVSRQEEQEARAMLHVSCTRAMTQLKLWGLDCPLMEEAEHALKNLTNSAMLND